MLTYNIIKFKKKKQVDRELFHCLRAIFSMSSKIPHLKKENAVFNIRTAVSLYSFVHRLFFFFVLNPPSSYCFSPPPFLDVDVVEMDVVIS